MKGKILKGVGGFYYVMDEKANLHECKARGRFRKDRIVPLPGDEVIFAPEKKAYGFIEEITDRRNELTRPRVANVDMAAIVVSAEKPKIDYMLCDKLLISIKKEGIEPLIVVNKCDVADKEQLAAIQNEYSSACSVVLVSATTGDGLGLLKDHMKGKCTCFAGQSAVGKSSIINALSPDLDLETGGLSKKIDQGKHTTRHAELLPLKDLSGTVVDTPGFSSFDNKEIPPAQLGQYYDDFVPYTADCKFSSCLHADEPECGVRDAVSRGEINQNRYLRYIEILNELQEKRLRKYD